MDRTDFTPPSMLPMTQEPPLTSTSGESSIEGAIMIQSIIGGQQYITPDMAMQFSQAGPHVTGVTTAGHSVPVMTTLASSVLGNVVQPSSLATRGPTAEPEDMIGVRSHLNEMTGAVGQLQGECPMQVTDCIASAPGRQEVGDTYRQGGLVMRLTEAGSVVDSAPNQVQPVSINEGNNPVIIQLHRVTPHELLSSVDVAQGNPQIEKQTENVDDSMETRIEQLQDYSTQYGTCPSADATSKQGADTEDQEKTKESKEVIFVCVHGQSFRCRPQAGIPVEAPVQEEPTDACACSKSKKLPSNTAIVKGGKLARKLRNRKQLFTCDKCGGRFSQKSALDLHMDAHEDEGEESEEDEAEEEVQVKIENRRKKSKAVRMPRRTSLRKRGMLEKSCPDCGKVFSRLQALAAHKRQHDREKLKESEGGEDLKKNDDKARNLSCTICQKKFTRMYDVERHMETHVDSDRKRCSGCGKEFLTIKSRERHESLHCDMKRQNKCNTCHLVLASKFKLLRHEREHLTSEQIDNLSCKDCAKVFTNPRSLLRHEKLHLKEKGALINCSICPDTFEDRFSYNIHRKTHAVKAYQCDLCSMKFKHEYLLNIHMKRMTCQKKRDSLRDVECNICQKVVKGTATLKRHMRTHTKEKPYPCRIGCNSSFSSTSNRLSHERMYCKLSPDYLCTHCGEVLSNQSRLIYHESKYHGIGPIVGGQRTANTEFPCRHCGKVFFFKGGRKRHERIHTNEKPFMCQFCPKAFVHASALVCHERVHTKERPYTCNECGKAFSQATHLKTHIRVHTKEKPYKCRHCDKSFSHMGTRKSHEGTHKNNPDPGMQAPVQQNQVPAKFHLPQQEHHVIVHPEIKVIHHNNEPVPHKIHVSHHEHEVQAADVILQLLESGSRVSNFEGLVHMASS